MSSEQELIADLRADHSLSCCGNDPCYLIGPTSLADAIADAEDAYLCCNLTEDDGIPAGFSAALDAARAALIPSGNPSTPIVPSTERSEEDATA